MLPLASWSAYWKTSCNTENKTRFHTVNFVSREHNFSSRFFTSQHFVLSRVSGDVAPYNISIVVSDNTLRAYIFHACLSWIYSLVSCLVSSITADMGLKDLGRWGSGISIAWLRTLANKIWYYFTDMNNFARVHNWLLLSRFFSIDDLRPGWWRWISYN